MYGYVRVYKPEMRFREFDEYRACYCGLCETLHRKYGIFARWTLSYDMTFLILLLTGLYEPRETKEKHRCVAHPFRKQTHFYSIITEYAADMSILLFRDKCMDDWLDEKKLSKKAAAQLLHRGYQKVAAQYPEKAHAIQEQLRLLHQIENENEQNVEIPAGCFGTLLSEIFAWKNDIWEQDLREIGFYLGKFIYLMDAYDDIEHDKKKNCYNPLFTISQSNSDLDKTCENLLQIMMASCAEAYERLPIVHYDEILRNILYAGVWPQFYQIKRHSTK